MSRASKHRQRNKNTAKHRVLARHRNAYSHWITAPHDSHIAVISLAGDGFHIGVGFSAIEAWADAARRIGV